MYIYICVPSPRFSRKIDRITAYAPASVAAYKNRNKKKRRLDRALHARTERRENAMLGKKGWKPGSVLQKIARSNESFLLIELITTPSPISFPHIFERNVGNGVTRCAVNQHRSANRIEKKIGRNWSSIIASSLSLSPFSKNCSKVNGCLNTVGARCPAFQLINETRRAGVESRGGGMENQERAAVILG